MKIVGIIAEFNPFHNGHLYFIQNVRKQSNADCLVAIITSSFSSRGDIAPIDKFTKTEICLNNGIDLVIELPFILGTQGADLFAYNSIFLLNQVGISELYFGSETNDLKLLTNIAKATDSKAFDTFIQKNKDLSYPEATEKAILEMGFPSISSNDRLGVQYIRSILKINPNIQYYSIKRIKSNVLDELPLDNSIASATSLRKMKDISSYVPKEVNEFFERNGFIQNEIFFETLKHLLIVLDLTNIYGYSKDLVGLVSNNDLNEIKDLNCFVSHHFTRSKISRLMAYTLLNVPSDIDLSKKYVRVLGMNENGQEALNQCKRAMEIPLITKVKEGLSNILDLELKVSRIYSHYSQQNVFKKEFQKPIIKQKSYSNE